MITRVRYITHHLSTWFTQNHECLYLKWWIWSSPVNIIYSKWWRVMPEIKIMNLYAWNDELCTQYLCDLSDWVFGVSKNDEILHKIDECLRNCVLKTKHRLYVMMNFAGGWRRLVRVWRVSSLETIEIGDLLSKNDDL